jgi:hypothetical protein
MSRLQLEDLFKAAPKAARTAPAPAPTPREGHKIVKAVLNWPQSVGNAVREGYRSATLSRGKDYDSFNRSTASFWNAAL